MTNHSHHAQGLKMVIAMDSPLGLVMCSVIITRSVALSVTSGGPVTTFTGGSSELTCSFSPIDSQGSSFAWSFDGQNGNSGQIGTCDITQCTPAKPLQHQLVISTDDGIGMMILTITNTQLSDTGNYTCLVSTSEDAQSALVQLNVSECSVQQPTIVCPANVAIGSFMDLSCSYTTQQSPGHYTRIAKIYLTDSLETVSGNVPNFNIVVNVTRDSIPNATDVKTRLKLTSLCCRSESSLTCRASDGENLCSDVCITNVLYPPSDLALTQSPPGPWLEGLRDASILCKSNGFPSPTVSWQRVDEEGSSGVVLANGTGSSTLNFSEVQRHYAGAYRCEADNHMESVERKTANISVQYPPNIVRRVSVVHANEGTVASLRCIVDANPTTSTVITWSTPNQSLIATDGAFVIRHSATELESRLLFTKKVHKDIFGNYTCTAVNALGRISFVIQLTGHCYPDAPYDLQVVNYTESSLTLSWTPGQDGGLPMTFTVSYCVNVSQVERCRKEEGVTNPKFTIDGLSSYTLYRITLLAENNIGTSGNVETFASTAPGTLDAFGITATYDMKSGRLDISSTESDTSDLCIHAEFHVGGLRKKNETCLLPGQTVYIRNGAREHQLWLVVCGRGTCSVSSRVTYRYSSDGGRRVHFIMVVTLGCCLGVILLVTLFICLYRLTRKRRSWNRVDLDGMSSMKRALPLLPTCALAIGIGSSSFSKDDDAELSYDAIENIKGKEISDNQHNLSINASNNATAQSPKHSQEEVREGYMPMDAAKATNAPDKHDKGIYTTHLPRGQSGPNQPEATAYRNTIDHTVVTSTGDKPVDLIHIEVNDDTYTVTERNKENGSEYMVPTSPGCDIKDTAL